MPRRRASATAASHRKLQPRADGGDDVGVHMSRVGPRIDEHAALGLAPGDVKEAVAQALVELGRQKLEPGRGGGTLRRTRQAFGHGKIEDQREVRREPLGNEAVQRHQRLARKTAAPALIGLGRIGEAVAQHDAALGKRRPDGGDEMAAPRRDHEQRLAFGVPALGRAGEEQVAQGFGAGRTAGLARRQRVDAGTRERRRQERDLCGLAGALAAFKGDEAAARQCRPQRK
jgi:hypothetical protein